MPFGIRPFRDAACTQVASATWGGLQCLSAFVRFGTREFAVKLGVSWRSPMPFGIRPFRDIGVNPKPH